MMNECFSPLIIIGMHRSGTTLLTKVFNDYGIFMGANVDMNSESIPFLKLNEEIFHTLDSEWYNVKGLSDRIDRNEDDLVEYIRTVISKPKFKKLYYKHSSVTHKEYVGWGWKDPRNSFSYPLYKKIYPKLKCIHLFRNPVDVARSLKEREKRFDESSKFSWFYNTRKFYVKHGFYVKRAPKLKYLEKGVKLWRDYVEQSFEYENEEILHIKYEKFLQNPLDVFRSICNFANISFDISRAKKAVDIVDSSPRYRFANQKELFSLYEKYRKDKLMIKLGYSNIRFEYE